MSTSTTPPTPTPQPSALTPEPTPSTPPAPSTAEVVASVEGAAGQAETVATDTKAVVSDLHQTAEQFKQEWDAASPQTKDAFHTLLRDASILRGEAFLAFKKLIGHLK